MAGTGAFVFWNISRFGRVGNADGFWGPNVSSAPDFLAWYERWLDQMADGRDNRALAQTSPPLRAHPHNYRLAPRL
ncbi:hypothetical protein [Streptomyces sp. NPDC054837]